MTAPLTAERVRKLLDYDPETGAMTWRATGHYGVHPGEMAGGRKPNGRWKIGVDYRDYLRSRFAPALPGSI
jgi:hypothetical protein